jgi:2-haloacid dehalogenase
MTITHIFFDLHGTLIDGARLHPCYTAGLGRVMAGRYGGDPAVWATANARIVADWDSYYADLNLTEDVADVWEGYLRTTRALFRLTGITEPPLAEVTALSRELPGLAPQGCDACYPDVPPVIRALYQAGYTLGICTHALTAQARTTLAGGGLLDCFAGPLIGFDEPEQFEKDGRFFGYAARAAGVDPAHCLAVDDLPAAIAGARAAGMRTAYIDRRGTGQPVSADWSLSDSLTPLLDQLQVSHDHH